MRKVVDLWPGDFVVVRNPGGLVGISRRVQMIETVPKRPSDDGVLMKLVFDGFSVFARIYDEVESFRPGDRTKQSAPRMPQLHPDPSALRKDRQIGGPRGLS